MYFILYCKNCRFARLYYSIAWYENYILVLLSFYCKRGWYISVNQEPELHAVDFRDHIKYCWEVMETESLGELTNSTFNIKDLETFPRCIGHMSIAVSFV